MKTITLWAFILFLIFPGVCFSLERFEIITTSEMQQLLDERKQGKIDFLLINALDEMIYNHSAIPGSINIPLNKFTKYFVQLGNNKNKLMIPY